jgi:chromosome segregation ATPase
MVDGSVLSEDLRGVGSGSLPLEHADPSAPDLLVETEQSETAPESEGLQVDWEAPENPYRERLRRMQGAIQAERERVQQLQREQDQLREQIIQAQTVYMTPEERNAKLAQFRAEQALQRQQQMLNEQQMATEMASRQIVIERLSRQYGVPSQDLELFNDPIAMQTYAQRVSTVMQQSQARQRQVQRQTQRVDQFEPASSVAPPPRKTSSWDEALQNIISDPRSRGI